MHRLIQRTGSRSSSQGDEIMFTYRDDEGEMKDEDDELVPAPALGLNF